MKYKIKIDSENSEGINLSEDEIIEIKYNIGLIDKNDYANNRSSVELKILGKVISNMEEEESVDSIYDNNKRNVINLIEWAKSYMEKSDYRDVFVEVDLGAKGVINYEFTNMFVYDFSQEFSIEKGIGIFSLDLKQKFYKENRLEVK